MKRFLACSSIAFALCIYFPCCRESEAPVPENESPAEAVTPVTVTHPETGTLTESVELNAVSAFLLKTYAKANINGYIESSAIKLGDAVVKGQKLFVLKTKEARSLGNTINKLDTSLHFEGTTVVASPGNGYITQLNYTTGNYVQDGEQLAEITDTRSFVFILDLPYELRPFLPSNSSLPLHLPDGTVLEGRLDHALPVVDSVSQTQRFIIKVILANPIPEKLIAKVNFIKRVRPGAISLPKSAILSDEVQSRFWIMKLIDSSTAVKIPVVKGLETATRIEIISPVFSREDLVLVSGNYSLPDTAKIKITQQ